MRKYLFLVVILFLISCGGGSDDEPIPPPVNVAPSIPVQRLPNNNELCTENPLGFEWSVSIDNDGDAVSYEIQVATDSNFTTDLQTKITSNTTVSISLIKGVAYYWRVRSKDIKNNFSSYSTVRKYYTEGDGVSNHIPFVATLVSPGLGSRTGQSIILLEWNSSDVDSDPLVFDVYFGKTNPPVLVTENSSNITYSVNLETVTDYYWKIVTKDDKGGQAIGQIWSFSTE